MKLALTLLALAILLAMALTGSHAQGRCCAPKTPSTTCQPC
jgi:hypothetical protein